MKVLIVGLGSIAKKHIEAIKMIQGGVEFYALRSKENSEKYHDIVNIFNINEIDSLEINFAIISNPTSEHKKTISKLIKYGFPLFIEKPIYSSLDIKEEIDSILNKGIITYIACNLRFLNCIKFIKDQMSQLRDNRLNEVNVYCGSYLPDWRPGIDFRKSYSAIPELGGGVHIDLIHELDYLYWLFGEPINVKRSFKNQSSLEIKSFDYANYVLDYDSFCANVVLNYYRRDAKRSLELVFNDETWNVDLLKNEITFNNQLVFSSEQIIFDTYKTQMEYFISCLKEKKNTFNTILNAFDVLKICFES
jgi:predicted dehydrogenase